MDDGSADTVADSRHCDVSRGSASLFLHPVEGQGADPHVHLTFTKNGRVEAIDGRAHADVLALNLNAAHLVRARAEIFELTWRRLRERGFGVQALRQWERAYEVQPGTRAREYGTFMRYHLRKKLRSRDAGTS